MNISSELIDYISKMRVSNKYEENYSSLYNLSIMLDKFNISSFDLYIELIEKYSFINDIVRSVVNNNMDAINSGNISSICNNQVFSSFIEAYCMNNGMSCYEEDDDYDIDVSNYYYKRVMSIPVLSAEEEKELFLKYRDSSGKEREKIRKEIIEKNLRLVLKIASRFNGERGLIVSNGNMGLIKAFERFDVSKGYKFSTYAAWWIFQAIMREGYSIIKTTSSFDNKLRLYNKKMKELECVYGSNIRIDQITSATGLSIDDIVLIRQNINPPLSLDSSLVDDDDMILMDLVKDDSISIQDIVENKSLRNALFTVFKILNFDQRTIDIISMRFGLDGNEPRKLGEIGRKYGITRERVRQIIIRHFMTIRRNKDCIKILKDYMCDSEIITKKY